MNVHIRRAKHEDAEGIIAAHVTSIRQTCSKDYRPEEISAWSGRNFKPHLWCQTMDRDFVWVVEWNGAIHGFAHLAVMNEEVGEVMGLYLTPVIQGKGLAKNLFSEMLKVAREHKLTSINLYSTITAKPFYESLGFFQSEGDTSIEMQGVPIPCFPMQLIIG